MTNKKKTTVSEEVAPKTTARPSRGIGGQHKAAYRNPYNTEIPKEIEKFFRSRGYTLRWVRVIHPKLKMPDHERVNYFLAIGGQLVTADDIRKIDPTFLANMTKYEYQDDFIEENNRGSTMGVKRGDLVLMQLPVAYTEEKRKDTERLMREQLRSTQREYQNETEGKYKIQVSEENIPVNTRKEEDFFTETEV